MSCRTTAACSGKRSDRDLSFDDADHDFRGTPDQRALWRSQVEHEGTWVDDPQCAVNFKRIGFHIAGCAVSSYGQAALGAMDVDRGHLNDSGITLMIQEPPEIRPKSPEIALRPDFFWEGSEDV